MPVPAIPEAGRPIGALPMRRPLAPPFARPSGWTLVEASVTAAVAAGLLALALPSMATLRLHLQVQASLHALSASMALARANAVQRGVPTTACPSADGLSCRVDADWSSGWIVYVDPGLQPQPASPDALIEVAPALPPGLQLMGSPGRPRLRYQPDGMAGGHNLSLRLCGRGAGAPLHATVVVSRGGRVRVQRPVGAGTPC